MNKSIKAINKKDISNSRTQYLNHIRLYKISITVLRFLILMAFIAAWEISTRTGILNPFIFSSPSRICTTFIAMAKDNSIFIHIWTTLFETFLSFFLIIIVGMGAAILLWLWKGLSDCLEPFLIVLNSLPKSALAPMIIVWLGNVIPFDGVVVTGEAMVNQASLTGEAVPVSKNTGSAVFAGTVIEEGELTSEV